ncbi:hypothetical protein FACS1894205_4170 [Alphaproteobacteria bacterium]|nr:hypothetical protein FACS1894205_4170 [Alphaproteobacteria bacterium]
MLRKLFCLLGLFFVFSVFSTPSFALTDREIKAMMIEESVNSFKAYCPCPYSTDKEGRSCNAWNGYSRTIGVRPLCYLDDINEEALEKFVQEKNIQRD